MVIEIDALLLGTVELCFEVSIFIMHDGCRGNGAKLFFWISVFGK